MKKHTLPHLIKEQFEFGVVKPYSAEPYIMILYKPNDTHIRDKCINGDTNIQNFFSDLEKNNKIHLTWSGKNNEKFSVQIPALIGKEINHLKTIYSKKKQIFESDSKIYKQYLQRLKKGEVKDWKDFSQNGKASAKAVAIKQDNDVSITSKQIVVEDRKTPTMRKQHIESVGVKERKDFSQKGDFSPNSEEIKKDNYVSMTSQQYVFEDREASAKNVGSYSIFDYCRIL